MLSTGRKFRQNWRNFNVTDGKRMALTDHRLFTMSNLISEFCIDKLIIAASISKLLLPIYAFCFGSPCSRHRKDFNFHASPSNHVRVSSTNFIQRSSKYNIKNNENRVTAAVIGSSERAPTFRPLFRSRNIPCATRYCEPATAGQLHDFKIKCRKQKTDVEYADIVYVYGLCDGSSLHAIAEYERRFPNRRVPYRRVLTVYGVG
ncbi:hypothetical protein ANN_06231 [Periplaneta americana]|uniref:DUF4817 domain-containing protein n=1 Tax=Periplaneta americana TaxID=6978 RepID=A0ABQ8TER2_PERAM|nr:hypothetical protein ANN_06231 [Periplaneta americana]